MPIFVCVSTNACGPTLVANQHCCMCWSARLISYLAADSVDSDITIRGHIEPVCEYAATRSSSGTASARVPHYLCLYLCLSTSASLSLYLSLSLPHYLCIYLYHYFCLTIRLPTAQYGSVHLQGEILRNLPSPERAAAVQAVENYSFQPSSSQSAASQQMAAQANYNNNSSFQSSAPQAVAHQAVAEQPTAAYSQGTDVQPVGQLGSSGINAYWGFECV